MPCISSVLFIANDFDIRLCMLQSYWSLSCHESYLTCCLLKEWSVRKHGGNCTCEMASEFNNNAVWSNVYPDRYVAIGLHMRAITFDCCMHTYRKRSVHLEVLTHVSFPQRAPQIDEETRFRQL